MPRAVLYSSSEVAERIGRTMSYVRKMAPMLAREKVGGRWLWDERGIQELEARKGKVGKRARKKPSSALTTGKG